MNPPRILTTSLPGTILTMLWLLGLSSAWGAPLVSVIDFNSNGGDFTVANTNSPIGPWAYDASRGSWSSFDTNDCAIPYRSSRLNSPILTVANAGSVTLTFSHRYSFEADTTRWDGGQVRISVNGAAYVAVPLASFSANGYNNTIGGAAVPGCELAGQDAFTAQSDSYDVPQYITSVANLGSFNANDTISIQFLGAWDDCSQGMVPNWEIDRVEFSPALEDRRPPPTFVNPAQPADATVPERQAYTLQSAPAGHVTVQWFKDDVAIPGATDISYIISPMTPTNAGRYFLQAVNSMGSSTSRVATISFVPDTTPPSLLSARCGANPDDFTIQLSEPLEPDNGAGATVDDTFVWAIDVISGPGGNPGVPATVTYTPGDTVIYFTASPGSLDFSLNTYRVTLNEYMVDTAMAHNVLPAGSSVTIKCPKGISVEANGAGPFSFATLPAAVEFATVSWPGAANGTTDTPAIVDGRVQLLDASTITAPLAGAPGTPPAATGLAQWASNGLYLITRPTSVLGCLLLARLENDSGADRTAVDISYDLTVQNPVVEEAAGHLVCFSLTGAPSSWRQIPGISTNGTTGSKRATLDLAATPWTTGSLLYVLWVDDNGSGSPDSANQIDNFAVSFGRPSLSIRYSSPNITITWPAGSGILQSKTTLADPSWTDVPGAGSSGSAALAADGPNKYFILRAP